MRTIKERQLAALRKRKRERNKDLAGAVEAAAHLIEQAARFHAMDMAFGSDRTVVQLAHVVQGIRLPYLLFGA